MHRVWCVRLRKLQVEAFAEFGALLLFLPHKGDDARMKYQYKRCDNCHGDGMCCVPCNGYGYIPDSEEPTPDTSWNAKMERRIQRYESEAESLLKQPLKPMSAAALIWFAAAIAAQASILFLAMVNNPNRFWVLGFWVIWQVIDHCLHRQVVSDHVEEVNDHRI